MLKRLLILTFLATTHGRTLGQITKPEDAPKPLPPSESIKTVRLPDGFRLELVAAEPLIRQPTGVCWDAKGNLFVAELHGYNREGQFDIEDLNQPPFSPLRSGPKATSRPSRQKQIPRSYE